MYPFYIELSIQWLKGGSWYPPKYIAKEGK